MFHIPGNEYIIYGSNKSKHNLNNTRFKQESRILSGCERAIINRLLNVKGYVNAAKSSGRLFLDPAAVWCDMLVINTGITGDHLDLRVGEGYSK